jgi:hypothetical protein
MGTFLKDFKGPGDREEKGKGESEEGGLMMEVRLLSRFG